ncbi:MAG TPA: hypothetical protein VEW94_14525, partial [Chloroflexia bacterium]|nr:hypothetical protein [Chloroflexia bacterium]
MLTITLPFSIEALQDAVRRYLSRPALAVDDIVPEKLSGGVSGSPVYRLKVSYRSEPDSLASLASGDVVNLVLKRGKRHTGAILAGSARREADFYRMFAHQLPVRTPRLLLTADDVVGEPTRPLVVGVSDLLAHGWDRTIGESDWVLM